MHPAPKFALLLVLVVPLAANAADPFQSSGKLDEVTVYRDQALVLRKVELSGPAGLREVVVTNLPEYIVPDSLYAESADGVEVRSVRYRIRPVMQDVREEVRELDKKIRELQDLLQANARHRQLICEQKEYLDHLKNFVAPTASVELSKGVLNAETLKTLTEFQFDQRRKIAEAELKLGDEQRKLTESLQLATRERDVRTGASAKTVREAVVFVNVKQGVGQMRVGYLVANASWSPSYSVRTDAEQKDVTLEYNAAIQQMSGEDWNDVKMTLSTANPSLVAKAPALNPLAISLGPAAAAVPPMQVGGGSGAYFMAKQGIAQRKQQLENQRNSGVAAQQPPSPQNANPGSYAYVPNDSQQDNSDFDSRLNDLAGESQVLDLVVEGQIRSSKGSVSPTEGVSVSYQLPERTSLPSRADRQMIQIAALPMKAEFYKVATPVLTSYVYQQATITNSSNQVLLSGPVSSYMRGQFVGRGELPLVAVGESFTIGFGIDSSLRATRELLTKNETIQGGNRLVDFTYRVKVENFGAEKAHVRVLDRMPSAKQTDIKISLLSPGKALSEDEADQADRKKGILRWEMDVPPQAIGPKALAIDYKLQLEYDKQLAISGMPTRK